MIILDAPTHRLSRATTRERWKQIWRWKRVTEQAIKKTKTEQIALLSAHGYKMSADIRRSLIDRIINPPWFLGPTE